MKAYLDSSVILRVVLGEAGQLKEWSRIDAGATSALTEVECLRTLDRLLLLGRLTADGVAERRAAVFALLSQLDLVDVSRRVLAHAAQPFPTPLGSLDAIHLATALLWRDEGGPETLATHDAQLATAAKASGLSVIGM